MYANARLCVHLTFFFHFFSFFFFASTQQVANDCGGISLKCSSLNVSGSLSRRIELVLNFLDGAATVLICKQNAGISFISRARVTGLMAKGRNVA